MNHIRRIQDAGLDVCSGGIFGLGETEKTASTWPSP